MSTRVCHVYQSAPCVPRAPKCVPRVPHMYPEYPCEPISPHASTQSTPRRARIRACGTMRPPPVHAACHCDDATWHHCNCRTAQHSAATAEQSSISAAAGSSDAVGAVDAVGPRIGHDVRMQEKTMISREHFVSSWVRRLGRIGFGWKGFGRKGFGRKGCACAPPVRSAAHSAFA
jgi:hypothetical protein